VTDSLLYSWDELFEINATRGEANDQLELRIVESDIGVHENQYSIYSQPRDFIDLDAALNLNELPSLIEKVKRN
jgi:hypothetical protein